MNLLLIGHISSGSDSGDASEIRTRFIKKGLEETGCHFRTISYKFEQGVETRVDNHTNLYSKVKLKGKLLLLYKALLAPWVLFFKLLMLRTYAEKIVVDRLPIYLSIPVFLFSILFRKKTILILNEFPQRLIHSEHSLRSVSEDFSLWVLGKVCCVLIIISREHEKVYKQYIRKKSKTIVLPILMDCKKKSHLKEGENTPKRVIYAGALSESNGVSLLVKATKKLIDAGVDHHLTIVGPSVSQQYTDELNEMVKNYNLDSVVEILPPKTNLEAIKLLSESDVLVIPKLDDQRGVGYIPSKLGDFLFTGNPVVCSRLGDVPDYITDLENGFLIEPNSVDSLSKCISEIISDYDYFKYIGEEGIKVALNFDYRKQCQGLSRVL
ncbi:glycosyltransferase [Vibrio campbellii]|uniref:glycosyltransferase n=1 Tax=Vibrio campbellii TaxID=680 RepID=UPI003857BB28